jgi:GNAT superfamily N-acetyltransferase
MDDFGFVPQEDNFGFQADEAPSGDNSHRDNFGFVPEQPKATPKYPRKNENYGNEDKRTPQPGESSTEAAGRKSSGLIQAGLGMVAGVPSTIAGGLYGLGALTSGQGVDEAVRRLHAAQESNFGLGEFKPWTPTGEQYSENLGQALNKPVEMVQQGTENLTGSPAAGAIAGGVMAAGMQFVDPFIGIKGMKVGAVKLSKLGEKAPNVARNVDDIIASKQAAAEAAKKPLPENAGTTAPQGELFTPEAPPVERTPYAAPEAGAPRWVTDENGMPVREDLSIQAQTPPGQRDLFAPEEGPAVARPEEPIGAQAGETPKTPAEFPPVRDVGNPAPIETSAPAALDTGLQKLREGRAFDMTAEEKIATQGHGPEPGLVDEQGVPFNTRTRGQGGGIDFDEMGQAIKRLLNGKTIVYDLVEKPTHTEIQVYDKDTKKQVGDFAFNENGKGLTDVHVDPEYRRQGIATDLFNYAESRGYKAPPTSQEGLARSPDALAFHQAREAKQNNTVDIVRTATGFVAKQGGKEVGRLESNMTPEQNRDLGHDKEFPAVVSTVGVNSSIKGQGVGKALYDAWRADHNDNVMPSGQTTADAWRYWKRNAPEKVDQFIKQEAERAAFDPRALRSITDDTVRRQVAEHMEQNTLNAAADSYVPGQSFNARTRGQGGAIRIGSEKEPALKQLKRMPGLKKDLAGFAPEPLRGDEFIAKYKDAADVEQNVLQRAANYGTKSMDYQVQKTRNPLVKVGAEEIKGAMNRAAGAIREIVHDGYAKLSRALSKGDKGELAQSWEALEKQRVAKTYLTADELEQANLSKKSREFILNHRATMDDMLTRANEALALQGHKPISPEVAHTASKVVGNFRRVMYKTVDGEKRAAGALGSNWKLGLESQTKKFLKAFPDTEPGPVSSHMTGGRGADINGMMEALNFMEASDPVVAEFNKRMQELADQDVLNTKGFKTHMMQKKGVPGMPGNRPWESPYQNAKHGIEAQIAYIERVIQMSELAKANENLKPLLAKDNGLDMPAAKAYVQDKLDAALGRNPSKLAQNIQNVAAGLADWSGIGTTAWGKLGTGIRQVINAKLLGLRPSFLLGNIVDPIKGMPGVTQYLAQRGVKVSGTGLSFNYRALLDAGKLEANSKGANIPIDPLIQKAVKYAEENHVYNSDLFEHSNEAQNSGLGRAQDVLQYAPGKIEGGTRQNVFLAFVRMLDERSDLTPKTGLFETAHKATDMVMNTYTTHDTPAAIQSMGALGKLPYNLMSYKANQWSKIMMFARDMEFTSPSTWKPLATELLSQTIMGGLKGVVLYQEADYIVRHISQMLGHPTSISKILFDNRDNVVADLPVLGKVSVQDIAHGLPSAVTGVDMSNAMGIGNTIPDLSKPADTILPGASALGQGVKSGFNFATDPRKFTAMKAAVDILPGGSLLMGQLGKAVPGVGKPFFSRQTEKGELGETISSTKTGIDSIKGGVLRTPADVAAKAFGMTGVHESEARQGAYEEGQIEQYYQGKRDTAMNKLAQDFLVSNTVNKSAIQDFVNAQGDPKKLPAEIDKMVHNQFLTQQQAMILKQAAAKSIGGAEALKRMRSFH